MDDLLDQFDDLEVDACTSSRCQLEESRRKGKGKQPVEEEAVQVDYEDEGDALPPCPRSPTRSATSEAGDLTCAICLGDIRLEDMAMVKGCDHIYCAGCILHWTLHKEAPWCPQCKRPFNYLLTYRTLDGHLQDFPAEESVVLLKRARWFEDSLKACERAKGLLEDSRAADDVGWQEYADDYDLAEDEEIEAFYFSSAAGRARVVVGNRRFGEGGFISGGRRQARPVPPHPAKGKGGGKPGRIGERAVVSDAGPSTAAVPIHTPNAHGGRNNHKQAGSPALAGERMGSSPANRGLVYGSSPSGSGRRARRNARRQAQDAATASAWDEDDGW